MQNLSCENEFYLHDNKKSFSQERFCSWSRFKTEACSISENMAYCLKLKLCVKLKVTCDMFAVVEITISLFFTPGHKLDIEDGTLDVSKHGKHFYLLVHNYKVSNEMFPNYRKKTYNSRS